MNCASVKDHELTLCAVFLVIAGVAPKILSHADQKYQRLEMNNGHLLWTCNSKDIANHGL